MLELLKKIANSFKKATIIVTGYYPIVSDESHINVALALAITRTDRTWWLDKDFPFQKAKMATLSKVFVEEANKNLSLAVKDANTMFGAPPRIFFVDPQFTTANSAYAPQSLLHHLSSTFSPQDKMAAEREKYVEEHKDRLKEEGNDTGGYATPKRASAFHPNENGARQYFNQIKKVLGVSSKTKHVAIRANSGHFIAAELGTGQILNANRNTVGGWETFRVIELGNNKVAILSIHGKYVSIDTNDPSFKLVARNDQVGALETFEMIPRGGSKISLRAGNGKFVCAENGGGMHLAANRDALGNWEDFTLV